MVLTVFSRFSGNIIDKVFDYTSVVHMAHCMNSQQCYVITRSYVYYTTLQRSKYYCDVIMCTAATRGDKCHLL